MFFLLLSLFAFAVFLMSEDKSIDDKVVRGFVKKIRQLEKERDKLLQETSQKTISSLKNQIEELLLEREESKRSLLHFMNSADEAEKLRLEQQKNEERNIEIAKKEERKALEKEKSLAIDVEMKRLKEELQQTTKEQSKLEEFKLSCEKDLEDKNKSLDEQTMTLKQLEDQNTSLKNDVQSLDKKLFQQKADYDQKVTELLEKLEKGAIKPLETKDLQHQEALKRNKQQTKTKNKSTNTFDKSENSSNAKLKTALKENQSLQKSIESLKETNNTFKHMESQLKEARDNEQKIKEQKEKHNLKTENNQNDLINKFKDKEATCEKIEAELIILKKELEEAQSCIELYYRRLADVEDGKSKFEKPKMSLEQTKQDLESFDKVLVQWKAERIEQEKLKQQFLENQKHLQLKTASLELSLNEASQSKESLQQQKTTLEEKLCNAEKLLAKERKNLGEQLSENEANLKDALNKLKQTESSFATQELQNKTLSNKLKDTNEALEVIKSLLNERDQELAETRASFELKVSIAEDEKTKVTNELGQFKKITESLNSQLHQSISKNEALSNSEQEAKLEAGRLSTKVQSDAFEISILQKERKAALDEKNKMMDELQIKQAEFESSQSMSESLQKQLKESETKTFNLNKNLANLEKQAEASKSRLETHLKKSEAEKSQLNKVIEQKESDIEQLTLSKQESEKTILSLKENLEILEIKMKDLQKEIKRKSDKIETIEADNKTLSFSLKKANQELLEATKQVQENINLKIGLDEVNANLKQLKDCQAKEIEDLKTREGHLKSLNKTLKDEVRKLSKVRQTATVNYPLSIDTMKRDKTAEKIPPQKSVAALNEGFPKDEDDFNIEYFKNVIINFLESKITKAQLIPVLTMMLRLSPEETKRLQYATT